jgi:hypothetical protein
MSKQLTEKRIYSRNQHRSRYDFEFLIENSPELKPFVLINEHAIKTIDFSDPCCQSFKQIIIDELLRYKKLGYPNFIFVHPFYEELITYIYLLLIY